MYHLDSPIPSRQVLDVMIIDEAPIDVANSPRGTSDHPGRSPAKVTDGLGRLDLATGLHTAVGDEQRRGPDRFGALPGGPYG